ncbi:hypothetical protein [Vulcanisaeta distributa]|uniref:hypothetical protein n=1 Tax=Vulcanisaeta distributa TaxID=164451 RepID=UPI0006CFE34C|nr:hypothetical protein [Vulcanisaeta distributa]
MRGQTRRVLTIPTVALIPPEALCDAMVSARDGDDDITTHQCARPVGLLPVLVPPLAGSFTTGGLH